MRNKVPWFLSLLAHAAVLGLAAAISVQIETAAEDEREFVPLVSPYFSRGRMDAIENDPGPMARIWREPSAFSGLDEWGLRKTGCWLENGAYVMYLNDDEYFIQDNLMWSQIAERSQQSLDDLKISDLDLSNPKGAGVLPDHECSCSNEYKTNCKCRGSGCMCPWEKGP